MSQFIKVAACFNVTEKSLGHTIMIMNLSLSEVFNHSVIGGGSGGAMAPLKILDSP